MTYINLTADKLCDMIYIDPKIDLTKYQIIDPEQYNSSIHSLKLDIPELKKNIDLDVDHRNLQDQWFMPDEYKNFDLVTWLYDQSPGPEATTRITEELQLFLQLNSYNLLLYLKYLVDVMTANQIVWGIGRGSSVASYVLYLIGVHGIDPIKYNLDISEFIKEK